MGATAEHLPDAQRLGRVPCLLQHQCDTGAGRGCRWGAVVRKPSALCIAGFVAQSAHLLLELSLVHQRPLPTFEGGAFKSGLNQL